MDIDRIKELHDYMMSNPQALSDSVEYICVIACDNAATTCIENGSACRNSCDYLTADYYLHWYGSVQDMLSDCSDAAVIAWYAAHGIAA